MDKDLFFYELEGRGYTFQNKKWDETKHGFENNMLNMAWEMWSSAKHSIKAQAVPEGFVLVPVTPSDEFIDKLADVICNEFDTTISGSAHCATEAYKLMIESQEPTND